MTFPLFKRQSPNNLKYYFGSSWWCLNRLVVEYIIDYLNENPNYEYFFKHSLCPDECFFQTLVMNSPFRKNVKPNLHYIKWVEGKNSPEILKEHDFKDIISSSKLIARKFDIDIDKEIIKKLNIKE